MFQLITNNKYELLPGGDHDRVCRSWFRDWINKKAQLSLSPTNPRDAV